MEVRDISPFNLNPNNTEVKLADSVEVAQYAPRDIERLRITIRIDEVSDLEDSSLGIPLRFNPFPAGKHDLYTVGAASPA